MELLSAVEVGDDHSVNDGDPHSVFLAEFADDVSLRKAEGLGGVDASGDVGAGGGRGSPMVGPAQERGVVSQSLSFDVRGRSACDRAEAAFVAVADFGAFDGVRRGRATTQGAEQGGEARRVYQGAPLTFRVLEVLLGPQSNSDQLSLKANVLKSLLFFCSESNHFLCTRTGGSRPS